MGAIYFIIETKQTFGTNSVGLSKILKSMWHLFAFECHWN